MNCEALFDGDPEDTSQPDYIDGQGNPRVARGVRRWFFDDEIPEPRPALPPFTGGRATAA